MKRHLFALLTICLINTPAFSGSLTPPGPPGPTMKTLDEVEARVPLTAVQVPITIDEAGSYYLVEDLAVLKENRTAINITVSHVTIDLNGYTVTGPGKDAGTVTNAMGIQAAGFPEDVTNTTVMNGTVTGFRYRGLLLGDYAQVSNVKALANGEKGMELGSYAAVTGCLCNGNGGVTSQSSGTGMQCGDHCHIVNNTCMHNRGGTGGSAVAFGITTGYNAIVSGNICNYNTCPGDLCCGVSAGDGSQVTGNVCNYNNGFTYTGISCGEACHVADNCVSFNGQQIEAYLGKAISCSYGSSCINNTCRENEAYTLRVINTGSDTLVEGNTISNCDASDDVYGIHVASYCTVARNNIGSNSATGDGTKAVGIHINGECRVDSNHVRHSMTAAVTVYGIEVAGDENIIISNTLLGNADGDIYFAAAAGSNYFAANLMDIGEIDDGSANLEGTSPAANVQF